LEGSVDDLPIQASAPRVLLADDVRETLALLHGILEHDGIDVVGVAGDGFEAVDLADRLLPDVVMMDLRMPGLDGLEATRLIKQSHPWMSVVFFTFHDELLLDQRPKELGAFAYLLKGCSPGLMKQVIFQACGRAREERSEPAWRSES
jgi:CheY-like chemotaxis protein